MQLLIKQRVFSWSDTYDIYDEQGNQKYFVKMNLSRWDTVCMCTMRRIMNWVYQTEIILLSSDFRN